MERKTAYYVGTEITIDSGDAAETRTVTDVGTTAAANTSLVLPASAGDTNVSVASMNGYTVGGPITAAGTAAGAPTTIVYPASAVQYYRYTGDTAYIEALLPNLESAAAYGESPLDANGLVVTNDNDYWQTRQKGEVTEYAAKAAALSDAINSRLFNEAAGNSGSRCHNPYQIYQQAVKRTEEKRDMLIPAGIILDAILEERADIPINAIHMPSGLKVDLYPVRKGMNFGRVHSSGENRWNVVLRLGRSISTHQRISFCTSSCTLD